MIRPSLCMAAAAAFLAAQGAEAATEIGAVSAVNQDVDGTPPTEQTRRLSLGDDVFADERIESSALGSGQFLFLDQTSLTIARNSVLTLDKYVYDPDTQTGEFSINMTRGVLRFVGGRISKQTDAVIVTPTATIGIRGGMAVIIVDETGETRVMHIAGDYTIVRSDGANDILISRPNGVAVAGPDGLRYEGVAPKDLVRKTTLALVGRGEAGAARRPGDGDVGSSGVPGVNSEAKGAPSRTPISTKGEERRSNEQEEARERFTREEEEVTTALIDDAVPVDGGGEGGGGGGVDREPLVGVTGGASFSAAGAPEGLTSAAAGLSFPFVAVFDGSRIGVTAAGEEFVVPTENGRFTFGSAAGVSPLGPVSGAGFFDPDAEFTFAVLQADSGETGAFLAGTPSGAVPSTGTRTARSYQISTDLLTNGAAFLPSALSGFDQAGFGDLVLVSDANGDAAGPGSAAVATYLAIEGEGVGQRSGFGVLTAAVGADGEGGPAFAGRFQGTFSVEGAARVSTPVATLGDADGDAAFGDGARYFALSNNRELDPGDPEIGAFFGPGAAPTSFGTSSFAQLSTTTALDEETDVILTGGFASTTGVDLADGDLFVGRSGDQGAVGVVSPNANGLTLVFTLDDFFATGGAPDAETDFNEIAIAIGGGVGRSVALSGDRFAARSLFPGIVEVDGDEIVNLGGDVDGPGFQGAVASAALAGDGGIFPGGVNVQPAHLSWGWWAGDVNQGVGDQADALASDQRLHLSAWVAGDITASANIPINGVATYSGFATLSVIDNGVSFVDGAGVTLSYDFGDQVGSLQFTDLLGQNPTIAVTDNVFDAHYGGTAGIDLNGREGLINVQGSFFNGADGVAAEATAGNLAVQSLDNTVAGAGVFGAARNP